MAIGLGALLCYHYQMGFLGLWIGWVVGNSLSCIAIFLMLRRAEINFLNYIRCREDKKEGEVEVGSSKGVGLFGNAASFSKLVPI